MNKKMNFKLKVYFSVFILTSLSLTIIGFIASQICHSSVITLASIFHFALLVSFATKLYLIKRQKNNEVLASRIGVLVELICSTFICALCFSIVVHSLEAFFAHKDIHEEESDKLHHEHENLTQLDKIGVMIVLGGVLLAVNLSFLLLNLKERILRRKKRNYTRCQHSESPDRSATKCASMDEFSFKPFDGSSIRQENCYLILPSDLVKMGYKCMFTVALLSGPAAILINSTIYLIHFKNENNPSHHDVQPNQTNENGHHHIDDLHHHDNHDNPPHNHFSGDVFRQLVGFVLINIDPILAIILTFIYMVYFIRVFKLAALILAQYVPPYINVEKIKTDLKQLIPSIKNFHDFNLFEWTPFNLCVSMHFVLEKDERLTNFDHQRELSDAISVVRNYFTFHFIIHSLAVQPELASIDNIQNKEDQDDQCHIKSE